MKVANVERSRVFASSSVHNRSYWREISSWTVSQYVQWTRAITIQSDRLNWSAWTNDREWERVSGTDMSFVWYSSTVAAATAADCRVTYGRRTIRRTILVPQMNDDHRSEVDLYLAYYGQTPSKQYSFLSSSRSFFHWLHHHMKKDILITLIQTIDQLLDRLLAFLFTHSIISRDNQGQKETERREHLGYLERD